MYTKITIPTIITVITAILFSCCKGESNYDNILGEEVTISYDKLPKLKNKKTAIRDSVINDFKWTVINFIGKDDCSKCTIFRLGLWDKLLSYMRLNNFNSRLVFILRVPSEEFNSISETFYITKQDYEVYADTLGYFKECNTWLPSDNKSITMIVDSLNIINFIGNPLSNEDMEKKWIDFISQKKQ